MTSRRVKASSSWAVTRSPVSAFPIACVAVWSVTFQTTRLFANLTVADNVALAIMQRKRITRQFFSSSTELPEVRAEWSEILSHLGLAKLAYRKVVELAYGQLRLIELAIGLALHPKVLLLDEPAAGVPHEEAPKIP